MSNSKNKEIENLNECTECGAVKVEFVHMCPDSSNVIEVHGCKEHDDECGFCGFDLGGEG